MTTSSGDRTPAGKVLPLILGGLAILASWETVARLLPLLSPEQRLLLPTSTDVVGAFARQPGSFLHHFGVTLLEAAAGLTIGGALGFSVGVTLLRFRSARRLFYPWLLAFKAIPLVAFSYLLVIWCGNGWLGKIVMCSTISFIPVTVALVEGVGRVSERWYRLFEIYDATPGQRLLKLEVPATIPDVLNALKLTSSLSVVGAIVAEMAGSDTGLGSVLVRAANRSDLPEQFIVIFGSSTIALLLYGSVAAIDSRVQPRFLSNPQEQGR